MATASPNDSSKEKVLAELDTQEQAYSSSGSLSSSQSDVGNASAGSQPGPSWSQLEAAALELFQPSLLPGAPCISNAVKRSVHFASIDQRGSTIVLDAPALLRGYVSVGRENNSVLPHGDTTTWLLEWARARKWAIAEPDRGQEARIVERFQANCPLVLGEEIPDLLETAVGYAHSTTTGRDNASARHIFAALINLPGIVELLGGALGHTITADDLGDLRRFFLSKLKVSPAADERPLVDNWDDIVLGPVLRLTNVDADQVSEDASADPLGIGSYVEAFASLICRRSDVAPLSIGLFGEWGSGKSTFMSRLRRAIDRYTTGAQDDAQSRFFSNIVQIQFNAWHYSDANLWASLTGEFFEQLRAGGFGKKGSAIHAGLVERVAAHVSMLSSTAAAATEAEERSRLELAAAQAQRDKAAAAAAKAPEGSWQVLLDAVGNTYDAHKADLAELGLKTNLNDPGKSIQDFVKLVGDLQTLRGQLVALLKSVRGWRVVLLAGAILLAGFGFWTLSSMSPSTVVALLTALAAATAAIAPGIKAISAIVRATSFFAGDVDKLKQGQQKALLDSEMKLKVAAREAVARREARDHAQSALNRYRDGNQIKSPYRLLRYLLEDAPETKEVAREVGLISRARRLFQEVDEVARAERAKAQRRAAGSKDPADAADIDVPDRIVLYIDDLDRCTHEQVYAVLQAVHLLLAFDLFVVVVGVDLRWIKQAIAMHFRPEHEAHEVIERKRLAVDYLEKIFQVPFWLPRLSVVAGRSRESGFGQYIRSMIGDEIRPDKPDPNKQEEPPSPGHNPHDGAVRVPPTGIKPAAPIRPTTPAARLEALTFEAEEASFLMSPELGAVANKTPRAVKRLVNIYRLVRARLSPAERAEFLGHIARKPPLYPAVAAIAAIEVGQPLEVIEAVRQLLSSSKPDEGLLVALGGAASAVGEEVEALVKAVDKACMRPLKVGDYRRAADLVGRFSFNYEEQTS